MLSVPFFKMMCWMRIGGVGDTSKIAVNSAASVKLKVCLRVDVISMPARSQCENLYPKFALAVIVILEPQGKCPPPLTLPPSLAVMETPTLPAHIFAGLPPLNIPDQTEAAL